MCDLESHEGRGLSPFREAFEKSGVSLQKCACWIIANILLNWSICTCGKSSNVSKTKKIITLSAGAFG